MNDKMLMLPAVILMAAVLVLVAGCMTTTPADDAMMSKDAGAVAEQETTDNKETPGSAGESDAKGDGADTEGTSMMEEERSDGSVQGTSIIEKVEEAKASYEGELLAGTTTPYLAFAREDYERALEQDKVILLNFYAAWCPICRNEQKEAFEAFDTLNHDTVVGFRVNYKDSDTDDAEKDLAKEYGITYQHTKVIIKDGERVLKAPDSWTKNRYLEEIGKYAK